ncbi:MAG: hypothetical protein V1494_02540 [Candidatus Diapherotrites archaeon]
MNGKGVYTAIIAVIALVVLASFAYQAVNLVNEQKTMDLPKKVYELKSVWLKAKFALDSATGDAAYDETAAGCTESLSAVVLQNSYYQKVTDAINDSTGFECSAQPVSVNPLGGGEYSVSATLDCRKTFSENEISYNNTVTFGKIIQKFENPPGICNVNIVDTQADYCEIREFDGDPPC